MPKIYSKMSKRLAKKRIGYDWQKMQTYSKGEIKEGSIIHTCCGYNEVIAKIDEEINYWNCRKGWYMQDINIEMISGNYCSLTHCCTFPPWPAEHVLEYFKYRSTHPSEWGSFGEQDDALLEVVRKGENPFDENGCVFEQYIVKYVPRPTIDEENEKEEKLIYRATPEHCA